MPRPLRRFLLTAMAVCWGLSAWSQNAPVDAAPPAPEMPSTLGATNVFVIAVVLVAVAAIVVALIFRRRPDAAQADTD